MFRMCHVMLGMCHVMFGVCATMLVLSAATCAERRAASPQSGFMMSALFSTDRRTDGDAPVGCKTAEALAFSSAVVISTQSFWLIDITHVVDFARLRAGCSGQCAGVASATKARRRTKTKERQ